MTSHEGHNVCLTHKRSIGWFAIENAVPSPVLIKARQDKRNFFNYLLLPFKFRLAVLCKLLHTEQTNKQKQTINQANKRTTKHIIKGPVTQRFTYGFITAKSRLKVVSREADEVVRLDVEFKTRYSRFIDAAGRREKSGRCRTR